MRFALLILLSALTLRAGDVVEEIVAKVNGEVITRSELEKQRQQLMAEIQRDHGNTAEAKRVYAERDKDLLRDLIDQALLLQRGKDMSVNVETELVRRLDRIRESVGLKTLEELEKYISDQGLSYEDFKAQQRNGLITQQVIGREVGGKIQMPQDRVKKYYEENKQKFERPEQVRLREIFVSTENKEGPALEAAEKRARDLLEKVRKGAKFDELAKAESEGATAKERSGDLGFFKRGELAKEIEDVAFNLKKGEVSDLIRTKYGWLIIKIEEKHSAGIPPLADVEQEIQEVIYMQELQPALRKFVTKLREDAYIQIKEGYVDSGAAANQNYARLEPQDMSEDELIAPKGKRGGRSWLPPFRRKK